MIFTKIYKSLKKPVSDSQFTYSAKTINRNNNHFIGINGKGHLSLLLSTSKPSGKPENIQNLKLNHGIKATIKIKKKIFKKKFSILSCTSKNENLKEIFLNSLQSIVSNLPKDLSEKEVFERTKNLIELYNKISKNSDKDLQGFWGELFIIYFKSNKDKLIKAWHPNKHDNFDFYDNNQALEIKTTLSNDRKHVFSYEQLNSGSNKIVIGSIMLRKSRTGKTLSSLKKEIEKKNINKESKEKLNEIFAVMTGSKTHEDLEKVKFDMNYASENVRFFESVNIPRIREKLMHGLAKIKFESNLNNCEELKNFSDYEILK